MVVKPDPVLLFRFRCLFALCDIRLPFGVRAFGSRAFEFGIIYYEFLSALRVNFNIDHRL